MLTTGQSITYAQDGQEICRLDQSNLDRFLLLARFEPFTQIALHLRYAQPFIRNNSATCILTQNRRGHFEPQVVQTEDLVVDNAGMMFFFGDHFYTITYEGISLTALRTRPPEQTITNPYDHAIINPFPTLETPRTTRPIVQPSQRAYL